MNTIDLSQFVPYTLKMNKETSMIIEAGAIEPNYATRKLFDMKEVIYDKEWLENQKDNFDLYYMYRDLTRDEDKPIFQEHKVRFDVTIIPPNTLGKEYIKTAGHFHPEAKEDYSFPEVYEVMHGEGLYILQKDKADPKTNETEIIFINAIAGDQVIIPPGYGHVTINTSSTDTLVMNNLVSSDFNSIYEPVKEHEGAAYFYLKNNEWKKNPKYDQDFYMNEVQPGKYDQKPFYLSFIDNPEKWIFLNKPWTKDTWL